MGVLIYNIVIDNNKEEDIYITGPDVDMSDEFVKNICNQSIYNKYNNKPDSFEWRWQ